jgi:hypothetical protein
MPLSYLIGAVILVLALTVAYWYIVLPIAFVVFGGHKAAWIDSTHP